MANVSYATGGTGPYKSQIGWFNFNPAILIAGTTINFTNVIPNIGNVSFSLYKTNNATTALTSNSAGQLFSTGYTGVTGNSSIQFNSNGVTPGVVLLENIQVTDFQGNPLDFYIVTGDSESTIVANEYLDWVTDGTPWVNLATISNGPGPYYNALTGVGTQNAKDSYTQNAPYYMSPLLITENPSNITLSSYPSSTQASGFGIIINTLATTKSVSANYAIIGQVLTYTIPITAYGISTSTNVVLSDTLPNGVIFNSGSIKINGVSSPSQSPPNITLPDISPGATTTVTFTVTVSSVPNPNPVINLASTQGNQGSAFISGISNTVVTTINYAKIDYSDNGFVKSVNKSNTAPSDILTYTISLKNTGNTTATSVVFKDTIPSGTTFISNSLTLNGVTQSGVNPNPPSGATIGTLSPGSIVTLTFQVNVVSIPSDSNIVNNGTTTFNYISNPTTGTNIIGSGNTNTVTVPLIYASIPTLLKSVNEGYGTLGDTLTYTIILNNTGNTSATSVTLLDTLPTGTSFINNSLSLNGVTQIGLNPNPPGALLPNIPAGQVSTITFQATISTIPNTNPIHNQAQLSYISGFLTLPNYVLSNLASTTINYISLNSTKQVNNTYANIGYILTYTIPISNSGTITASNILFQDTIPNGTTFITNSFKQDGTIISGTPTASGITLPNSIKAGETSTVTFQVLVTSIPIPNPIPNSATTSIQYVIDPVSSRNGTSSTNTNTVTTKVSNANLSGATKFANTGYASCGDIIIYTIVVPNSGNTTAQNILFTDTIPTGTTFISNSFTINGVSQPSAIPQAGITLPNIPPYSTTTLSFSVLVHC